jgi:hypothetical protein
MGAGPSGVTNLLRIVTQMQVQTGERALASGSTPDPRIKEGLGSASCIIHVCLELDTVACFQLRRVRDCSLHILLFCTILCSQSTAMSQSVALASVPPLRLPFRR